VAGCLSPACLTGYVRGPFLSSLRRQSSDVASTAAFLPLVLSQRRVSRDRISEGRDVTIVEGEGGHWGAGSHHGVAGASGKRCVGRAVDDAVRHGGQDADLKGGGYRMNR
jgi:hypothetical protein